MAHKHTYVINTDAGSMTVEAEDFDAAVRDRDYPAPRGCYNLDDFLCVIEEVGDGAWGTVTNDETTEQHGTKPDEHGEYRRY